VCVCVCDIRVSCMNVATLTLISCLKTLLNLFDCSLLNTIKLNQKNKMCSYVVTIIDTSFSCQTFISINAIKTWNYFARKIYNRAIWT